MTSTEIQEKGHRPATKAPSVVREPMLSAVCILVLWISCLIVGGVGMAVSYARPAVPPKEPPPIQAEMLHVELTQDPLPELEVQPPSQLSEPPPAIQLPSPQQSPPMIAVAEPSPAISFALPVEGPTRIVEARQASYATPTGPVVKPIASAPVVRPLTYGQGEGKQPAPEYPSRASRAGQEGSVVVQFTVGESGRVLTAEAVSPSPWSLLNESAVRTVRERWRFPPGMIRLYEVAIRFQLKK